MEENGTLVKSTNVEKVTDPIVDLGNLLLIDRDELGDDYSKRLQERTRDNVQFLFNKIWELDRKRVEDAIVVELPEPTYRLPREKKIPEPKEPTKWEKYAKTKGIVKRKKDKKVFDEASGEWKPTYGYRRGNDNTKDWCAELPGNAPDDLDVFAERAEKKKERIAKNEVQRMKNLARQLKTSVRKGPSVDANIGLGVSPKDKTKQQLRFAVDRAKVSTASVGKFQDSIKGEKPNVKTGKKRKLESNVGPIGAEKDRSLDILRRLQSKKAKILEDKVAAVAGPEKIERKQRKNNAPIRQKSQIHRQQWFKNKKDQKKKRPAGGAKNKK